MFKCNHKVKEEFSVIINDKKITFKPFKRIYIQDNKIAYYDFSIACVITLKLSKDTMDKVMRKVSELEDDYYDSKKQMERLRKIAKEQFEYKQYKQKIINMEDVKSVRYIFDIPQLDIFGMKNISKVSELLHSLGYGKTKSSFKNKFDRSHVYRVVPNKVYIFGFKQIDIHVRIY